MRVNRDVGSLLVECEGMRLALEQIVHEFFEEEKQRFPICSAFGNRSSR